MAAKGGRPPFLITHDQLPRWVPGDVTSASDALGWRDVAQRGYLYRGQDVEIPPMDVFMIVHYRQGVTAMERNIAGRWTRATCRPGDVSLLSRSADSHWRWPERIEVSHVYLSNALLARVAGEMHDADVAAVELHDVLTADDPVIRHISDELRRETGQTAVGGALYVEALSVQLAVHLLRGYASVHRPAAPSGGLSPAELRRIEEFIDAHLHERISLDDIAGAVGLRVWTFNRRLRRATGRSAYALVVERRLERARRLLLRGRAPIKEIAAGCGFSDQAHMTRLFTARLGLTPAQVRAGA